MEQRIAKGESDNRDLAVPERPAGEPETFREHAELMFDLQALAFQADITRVSTFLMARENVNRSYGEIGLPEAHHSMSHHGNNPEKMADFSKLNTYHVETLAYFLKKLQAIPDGDGTLLDHSVVLYGSGMSDGNTHNNYNVPVVVVGGRDQQIKGNRHLRYPKGTPLANLSLTPDGQVRRESWRGSATAPASSICCQECKRSRTTQDRPMVNIERGGNGDPVRCAPRPPRPVQARRQHVDPAPADSRPRETAASPGGSR